MADKTMNELVYKFGYYYQVGHHYSIKFESFHVRLFKPIRRFSGYSKDMIWELMIIVNSKTNHE